MRRAFFFLLGLTSMGMVHATTLPPELKAYDFGEAYYVEDGGVVISPYGHGFICPQGIETPEGIRVMPGVRFVQLNPDRLMMEEYQLLSLNASQTRAFFRERIFHYEITRNAEGHLAIKREQLLGTDDFYLTQFRGMEPFDHIFTNIELHPGAQEWRVAKN